MRCVAVPDPLLAADPRYRDADLVIPSLTALDDAVLRRLGVPADGPQPAAADGRRNGPLSH